jgi:hypothetical protein
MTEHGDLIDRHMRKYRDVAAVAAIFLSEQTGAYLSGLAEALNQADAEASISSTKVEYHRALLELFAHAADRISESARLDLHIDADREVAR